MRNKTNKTKNIEEKEEERRKTTTKWLTIDQGTGDFDWQY